MPLTCKGIANQQLFFESECKRDGMMVCKNSSDDSEKIISNFCVREIEKERELLPNLTDNVMAIRVSFIYFQCLFVCLYCGPCLRVCVSVFLCSFCERGQNDYFELITLILET